jgi:hypothetical protein
MGKNLLVETLQKRGINDLQSTCLTPAFEALVHGNVFSTVHDPAVSVEYHESARGLTCNSQSFLVDETGYTLPDSPNCEIRYSIVGNEFVIQAKYVSLQHLQPIKFVLPIICNYNEKAWPISPTRLDVIKSGAVVNIEANKPFKTSRLQPVNEFTNVPGNNTIRLEFSSNEIEIKIRVA